MAEPPLESAAFEATTNRSLLNSQSASTVANPSPRAGTPAPPPPPPQAWPPPPQAWPPPPQAWPPPPQAWPPPGNDMAFPGPSVARPLPPEVVLVAVGLLALAALVLYPVVRYGGPVVPHVFDGNALTRAFATLTLQVLAVLASAGVALGFLAVGLLRGRRAAQVLTCVLCALVAVAEIVDYQQSDSFARPQIGVVAGSVIVAVLVIALLTLPAGARRFFAGDPGPVGVMAAAITNIYLGSVAILNALLLMIAGSVGIEYVWIGVAFAVVGLLLLATVHPLRNGNGAARVIVVMVYVGLVIAVFVLAYKTNQMTAPGTLVPVGLVIAALVGLIATQSSIEHFRQPPPQAARGSAAVASWSLMALVILVAAAVGFNEATSPISYGNSYDSASEPQVTAAAPSAPYTSSTGEYIDQDQASAEATQALDQIEGNGSSATTCGGPLPSLAINDYTIGDVTEQTSGTFAVSADVTLTSGGTEAVTFVVETDSDQQACVRFGSFTDSASTPSSPSAGAGTGTGTGTAPDDVPSVPATGDPIPRDAAPPAPPSSGAVIAYGDSSNVPTTSDQLVEYAPSALSPDQTAAVRDIIAFMTNVNRQDFQAAWSVSTERLGNSQVSSRFRHGYHTSHFYQVAFGQPRTIGDGLIVVPGRFVSRQDPAAQGNPSGVTDCTYWPQYLFVVAHRSGSWLTDVAGRYGSRAELSPFKRYSRGDYYLNPLTQRVSC